MQINLSQPGENQSFQCKAQSCLPLWGSLWVHVQDSNAHQFNCLVNSFNNSYQKITTETKVYKKTSYFLVCSTEVTSVVCMNTAEVVQQESFTHFMV